MLVALAAQTAAYLTNELVLGGRYHQLDAAADRTPFAWANTLAIVALAVLVAGAGLGGATRRARAAVLATGLLLLAADDATGVHDRLPALRAASLPGPPRALAAAALLAFALLLALVFLLLWAESRRASGWARTMMRAGLVALAAALTVRALGAGLVRGETFGEVFRALAVAGEQGLDLAGWLLVAAGYAVSLRDGPTAQSSSPPPHWPAFTATFTEKPRPASITAPTAPVGAAKTRRFSR